jgi:hypothetical protein
MNGGNSPAMESMMEVRRCRWLSKLSAMEESRSPRQMLGAWLRDHSLKSWFEHEKGQVKEWMTDRT